MTYEQEYHLTLEGWMVGNRSFWGQIQGAPKESPPQRVETWVSCTEQENLNSAPHRSWKLTWKSESVSDEMRGALRDKFPRPHGL